MSRCLAVYPRDAESTRWLAARGVGNVAYLGNPMLDAVEGNAAVGAPPPYLLLLPGSREDARFSLPLMLEAYRQLDRPSLKAVVAWSAGFDPAPVSDWQLERLGASETAEGATEGITYRYRHESGQEVVVGRGVFARVLAGARAALSTSGTAAEQCAGFGVPLVAFPTEGPQYTLQFAKAQKRALGEALTLSQPHPVAVSAALARALDDEASREAALLAGRDAMGDPGAADRIAQHILVTLESRAKREAFGVQ